MKMLQDKNFTLCRQIFNLEGVKFLLVVWTNLDVLQTNARFFSRYFPGAYLFTIIILLSQAIQNHE